MPDSVKYLSKVNKVVEEIPLELRMFFYQDATVEKNVPLPGVKSILSIKMILMRFWVTFSITSLGWLIRHMLM